MGTDLTNPIVISEAKWQCEPASSFGELWIKQLARYEGGYCINAGGTGDLFDFKVGLDNAADVFANWRGHQTKREGWLALWVDALGTGIREGRWNYKGKTANWYNFKGKLIPGTLKLARSSLWFGVGVIDSDLSAIYAPQRLNAWLYSCDHFGDKFRLTGEGSRTGIYAGKNVKTAVFVMSSGLRNPRNVSLNSIGGVDFTLDVGPIKVGTIVKLVTKLLKADKFVRMFRILSTMAESALKGLSTGLSYDSWESLRSDAVTLAIDSGMPLNSVQPLTVVTEFVGIGLEVGIFWGRFDLDAEDVTRTVIVLQDH